MVRLLVIALLASLGGQDVREAPEASREMRVTVGKSLIVDSPVIVERVSIANADVAEALAVTPREVLVNGKAPGETTLIVWQEDGKRLIFDLVVRPNMSKVEAIRRLIKEELEKLKDP